MVDFTPWVGYLAMAVLLISFTLKDVKKLRLVNSIGCLLFVIYGFMLTPKALPIIITNAAIIVINLYYLLREE